MKMVVAGAKVSKHLPFKTWLIMSMKNAGLNGIKIKLERH
jgi:hypothetical protein